jgi:thioredoxin reductase
VTRDVEFDLDVVIVGCGPAGLSAALNCLHHGLRFVTIEQESDVGGTVRHYPRKKLVMTSPVRVPGYRKLSFREASKEELIDVWMEIVQTAGLRVHTSETVTSVRRREKGGFDVTSTRAKYQAARVILAIGRRGVPRKLGVAGEDSPGVAYALREPEAYQNDRILVVGGGDSAVEAALALADQPGNGVRLSYRGEHFARIKQRNHAAIEAAAAAGRVEILWSSTVTEIGADHFCYRDARGDAHSLPNDRVFVFIGGELPTPFLRDCGIAIETKFGTA